MPDSMKKLREPAALATVAFVGLGLIGLLIGLLSPDGDGGFGSFSDRSYTASGLFLSFDFAIALAIAVYLANHAAGGPLAKARLITLAALVEAAVAIVFGVITMLAAFGADGVSGSAKFGNFLGGLGALAVLAVAAWYVWLTWQQHAPAKTPAAQSPAWSGGYPAQQQYGQPQQPQPGQYPGQQAGQYPGQPQPHGQPQAPGQQTPPPGGFGWTPQQQAGQAADRTQLLPPVPSGPAGFAASPQPWNPAAPQPGPGHNQGPSQGQPQQPGQSGEQPPQQQSGPFSVGDWRSDS